MALQIALTCPNRINPVNILQLTWHTMNVNIDICQSIYSRRIWIGYAREIGAYPWKYIHSNSLTSNSSLISINDYNYAL